MAKTIRVATIQMDAGPAPLHECLIRAENIVYEAAQAGAQLVVLPELFNTGYMYSDDNFQLAEPVNGKTGTWLKSTAARYNIHLAGTFMLLEQGEIYNSMLLFSPSGQMWRHDKNYPWAWERGYFRGRRGMTIAQTELGDLGMLICWDLGHMKLWKQYAGKVDMIVIASCPPNGPEASYVLPDEERIEFTDIDQLSSMKDAGTQFFGEMVDQQARWLGVPVVNSGASGQILTKIPKAKALLRNLSFMAPQLGKLLPKAEQMQMSAQMISSCKVVDASGNVLAKRLPIEGEGFVMAEVKLADSKPVPTQHQPSPPMDWMVAQMAVFNADVMIPAMMRSVYKNGLKQIRK